MIDTLCFLNLLWNKHVYHMCDCMCFQLLEIYPPHTPLNAGNGEKTKPFMKTKANNFHNLKRNKRAWLVDKQNWPCVYTDF